MNNQIRGGKKEKRKRWACYSLVKFVLGTYFFETWAEAMALKKKLSLEGKLCRVFKIKPKRRVME